MLHPLLKTEPNVVVKSAIDERYGTTAGSLPLSTAIVDKTSQINFTGLRFTDVNNDYFQGLL